MSRLPALWATPADHVAAARTDRPCLYFSPETLQATAERFRAGFPGLVTYAVKANDALAVIENLVQAGMTAFDVASPHEMRLVRSVLPGAVLHYNNPVRSRSEIAFARDMHVASYSVDSFSELAKLAEAIEPRGIEIAVRLKIAVTGAAYDFGAKFGAEPAKCVALLEEVANFASLPGDDLPSPARNARTRGPGQFYHRGSATRVARAPRALARLNVAGFRPSLTGRAQPL